MNNSAKPNFKGSFFRFEVLRNTDRENGLKEVFLVFSSGKREVVKNFLWHKLVWSQLTRDELELFYLMLTQNDEKEWAFLKMLTLFQKSVVRKRLNKIESILGLKTTNKKTLEGLYSINIEFRKVTRKLPKVPKYSGYIKSPSKAGSKRPLDRLLDEMVDEYPNDYDEELSWESLLSVDHVPFFSGLTVIGS